MSTLLKVLGGAKRAVFTCCLCFVAAPASAGVISAASSGYGLSVDADVKVLSTVVIDVGVGPLPLASGTAPAAYSDSASLAQAHATGVLGIPLLGLTDIIDVDTGLLQVSAQSNVDGGAGARSVSALAAVNNTNATILNVGALLSLSNLLSLDATLIQSTASVSGTAGALSPSGSTTIAGVHGVSGNQALLTVLGTAFLLDLAPAANTRLTIDSSLGGHLASLVGSIDVTLNEQIVTGDMSTSAAIDVNAIHIAFHGLAVGLGATTGLLNGDIIISHSEAEMCALNNGSPEVPEPASLSLLSLGMLSLGALRWRAKNRKTTLSA